MKKNRCTSEKSNVNDCSCLCELEAEHIGKHHCYCGQTWKHEVIADYRKKIMYVKSKAKNNSIRALGLSRIRIGELGDKKHNSSKRFFLAVYSDIGLTKKQAEQLKEDIVYKFNNFTKPMVEKQ